MKTLIIATIILLNSFNQSEKEPPIGADLIKIQTTLKSEELFTKWKEHLTQNNFSFTEINNKFLSIETKTKNSTDINYEYKLFSQIDETGIVQISIEYRTKPNQETKTAYSEFKIWTYSKDKDNINKIIYDEFYEIILSFGKYELYFGNEEPPEELE